MRNNMEGKGRVAWKEGVSGIKALVFGDALHHNFDKEDIWTV